jgi:predicted permease
MDPGFDVQRTIWAYMRLVPDKYADQTRQMALVHSALDRLSALPGIESAAITRVVPLNGNCVIGAHLRTDISSGIHAEYQCNDVGPNYFRTIGIPILSGREFTAADRKGAQPVAIVSENFARAVFGNINPVGHTFTLDFNNDKAKLIVGVAKDSKYFTLSEKPRLAVYQPYFASDEPINLHFLIRTAGSPAAFAKPITDVLSSLDATAAIEIKPMRSALGLALLPSRAGAAMLGATGVLGLALAAIGLYGVLLYSVSCRTREIGLRVALGATPSDVLRLIGRHTLTLVGAGIASGLTLSVLAVRPLALFLVPGVSALDSTAFLAMIGVLGVVALLAILTPAARALRIDPMVALRYE